MKWLIGGGIIVLIAMAWAQWTAAAGPVNLAPGEQVEVTCSGTNLRQQQLSATRRLLTCRPLNIATSTPAATITATLTTMATPTPSPTTAATIAPATSTPSPTAVPTATNTPGSGCVSNCGTPRFFCDTGNWAFCDDYRDLYCPVPDPWAATDPRCTFPDPSRVDVVTADAFSSSSPNYYPDVDGQPQPHGWFFNQQEHFHSNIEDGNFGIAVVRHHQPIDLSAERHIHYEVDFDTSARRYVRMMLSPNLTKAIVDDRNGVLRPADALDVWVRDGTLSVNLYRNGQDVPTQGESSTRIRGVNNVRDIVDVYVSRTSFRLVVNGQQHTQMTLPDIGFGAAYLYLSQVSYNPCKDNQCADHLQIRHWDNVAFSGPVLARNSLTPAGQQDVIFNAFRATACSVKGVAATAEGGATDGPVWVTWRARMPVGAVSAGDVRCTFAHTNNTTVQAFEVVR